MCNSPHVVDGGCRSGEVGSMCNWEEALCDEIDEGLCLPEWYNGLLEYESCSLNIGKACHLLFPGHEMQMHRLNSGSRPLP